MKSTMNHRCRRWTFTSKTISDLTLAKNLKAFCYQKERSESGFEHYQGYLKFSSARTGSQVKKIVGDSTCHVEPARGNDKQNLDYCTKELTRLEEPVVYGDFSQTQGQRNDLKKFVKDIKDGKTRNQLIDEHPSAYLQFSNMIPNIRQLAIENVYHPDKKVVVLWGKTRTGKTRWIYENLPTDSFYVLDTYNMHNVWFQGYDGQDILVIDEFNSDMPLTTLLKLCDSYPYRVQTKGGDCKTYFKQVYIVSNINPDTWYPMEDRERYNALMARITQTIHFSNPLSDLIKNNN